VAHALRKEPLSFVGTAPKRWTFEAPVAAPREQVFAAISADPKTWTWFPGISSGSRYHGDGPHGVGSIREARMGPAVYRETILAWDAPNVWAYRVDEMTVPLANALVEEWRIDPAPGGSVVRWTFAIDPRPLFIASGPLAPRAMGRLFRSAMRNLSETLAGSASLEAG